MSEIQGFIAEVFPSIQGEGFLMGAMQLFVRMAGCNLRCPHCDTPTSWERPHQFSLWPWPGHRPIPLQNPLSAEALFKHLAMSFPLRDFHSISITGGEPFHQPEFLIDLVRICHENHLQVFVETNATLSRGIGKLVPLVSYWSVDLKISRGWGLNGRLIKRHLDFLRHVPAEKTCLKMVLNPDDDPDVIEKKLNRGDFSAYPLAMQPFSNTRSDLVNWDSQSILEWARLLRPRFKEIRWIPQVHKLLRIP